jgi:hypothetical protein
MRDESARITPGAPVEGESGAHRSVQSAQKPVPPQHAPFLAHPRTGLITSTMAKAKAGLRALARRWLALDEEVRGHDVPQGLPARRHRYDKLASNYASAVALAAVVASWC